MTIREGRGVLYIATGKIHIARALRSADSVRRKNPELAIHLFSDASQSGMGFEKSPGPLTSWANVDDPHRRSKVDYLAQTPFDRTLFLDTDTRVLCDLDDLFGLLDQFDIALAHAHKRALPAKQKTVRLNVPDAFPQFNSGVLLYRKNESTLKVLRDWQAWFHEANLGTDQKTLREVLWASDLRIATLPPEYNVRFLKYLVMWSRDEARPRILHLPFYKEGLLTYIKRWRRRLVRVLAGDRT